MVALPPVPSQSVARTATSPLRIDDDASVARNVNFPLTHVKRVPVEEYAGEAGTAIQSSRPALPSGAASPKTRGTASGTRNRS
ncbi:hypothetical protein C7H84_03710 [Burkholderia sp. Nafp2/4-1b]|nr:hypothetical protein C7H84_03710 [Burkholderia sp. Nafp2/4-1b]